MQSSPEVNKTETEETEEGSQEFLRLEDVYVSGVGPEHSGRRKERGKAVQL